SGRANPQAGDRMIPRTIAKQLAGLRGRERLLQLAWGVARWLALVLLVLLACGFVDWLIDRDIDTPFWVRQLLFFGQIVVGLGTAAWLLARPLGWHLDDASLALKVEDRYPELGHRLISAVQLNSPDADTEGMSAELIQVVTVDAEKRSQRLRVAAALDHRRL